jgi:hypothetical protein
VVGYALSQKLVDYVYKPYVDELWKQYNVVRKLSPKFKIEEPEFKIDVLLMAKQLLARCLSLVNWKA